MDVDDDGNELFVFDPYTHNDDHRDYANHIVHMVTMIITNIATGETSQAITPFHFFDNLNFHL